MKNKAWRMKVSFSCKSSSFYLSEDIRHGLVAWNDSVFDKKIEKIEIFLPNLKQCPAGGLLLFNGFDSYNFHYECVASLSSPNPVVSGFYLRGYQASVNKVMSVRIGFFAKEWRITREEAELGLEWQGTGSVGWKKGEPTQKPFFGLFSREAVNE